MCDSVRPWHQEVCHSITYLGRHRTPVITEKMSTGISKSGLSAMVGWRWRVITCLILIAYCMLYQLITILEIFCIDSNLGLPGYYYLVTCQSQENVHGYIKIRSQCYGGMEMACDHMPHFNRIGMISLVTCQSQIYSYIKLIIPMRLK
jgi:hypothetical protein